MDETLEGWEGTSTTRMLSKIDDASSLIPPRRPNHTGELTVKRNWIQGKGHAAQSRACMCMCVRVPVRLSHTAKI